MDKKKIKCPICKKAYVSLEGVSSHLEEVHGDQIPKHMESGAQYYYFLKTGKSEGKCVVCGNPTKWNPKTNKYYRLCGNPKCKDKQREIYKKNMLAKFGKVTLMDDPEHQRKLLSNRKISGMYQFKNGDRLIYVGSYEKNFLEFLDKFFDWDPNDIMTPAPTTYIYAYDGSNHFYIPDLYIVSLDLNIEIKDGGKNPNMHHKIQAVDKAKERLKDEMMLTQKSSYVKIYDNNFTNFIKFLNKKKEIYLSDGKPDTPVFIIEDSGNEKVTLEDLRPIVPVMNVLTSYYSLQGGYKWNHRKRIEYVINQLKQATNRDELLMLDKMVQSDLETCNNMIANNAPEAYDAERYKRFILGDYKALYKHYDSTIKRKPRNSLFKERSMNVDNVRVFTADDIKEVNRENSPNGYYYKNNEGELFWNSIIWIDDKPHRETVETLVFKIDEYDGRLKVFMRIEMGENGTKKYRVPGGSIEPDVPNIKQAENEVNEEALLDISDIRDHNFTYMREIGKKKPMKRGDFDYRGKLVHMYSAMCRGPFTGHVEDKDRDEDFIKDGKFFDVVEIYKELSVPFKRVIDEIFPAINSKLL